MNAPCNDARPPAALHAAFLAIVPRIERHGRVCFRGLKDAHGREDAVAEMVAVSWRWFLRLAERGKDPARFPSAIAGFAARAVRSGRRACGQEKGKDALTAYQLLERFYRQSVPVAGDPSELHRTTESLFRAFRSYGLIERSTRLGRVVHATRLRPEQARLLRQLGFPTPAQLLAQVLAPLRPG